MSRNKHLVEIDPLTARSWMCLMPIDQLVECSLITNIQLLDILHIFDQKTSLDITYNNYQVKKATHSLFNKLLGNV